jgi:hypothetical protein
MLNYIIYLVITIYVIYKIYKMRHYEASLEDNKGAIQKLLENGYLTSLSILPIFSETNDSYEGYFKIIDYLDNISKPGSIFRRNKMSIKIQQLSLNKAQQWKYLIDIVNYAEKKNIFIWLSAITSETLDTEYEYLMRLNSMGCKNVGITLAAYNSSVCDKIDNILSKGGHVRLVKGIYEGNIHDSDHIDKIYYENAIKLIRSGYYHTIATHDFKILKRLYDYNTKFNDYIEIAFFYNSYSYATSMLKLFPFENKFISFYIPHGKYYPFLRDNISLYSLDNIFYIMGAKINGFIYDLM